MAKIFVIDDETDVLISIKAWGEEKGYQVTTFENSHSFLDSLLEIKPEIVLVDINLKDDDGRNVCHDLKNILPFPIKIILISADAAALLDYDSHYADGILNKPFTFTELEQKLKQQLRKKSSVGCRTWRQCLVILHSFQTGEVCNVTIGLLKL